MANPTPRGARLDTESHPMNYGTAASPNVSIGPGSRGVNVKELQAKLNRLGYQTPATGDFDSSTSSAVQAFQAREGLPVTGIFGMADAQRVNARLTQLAGLGAQSGGPEEGGRAWTPAQVAAIARGDDPTGPLPVQVSPYQLLPTWQKGLMLVGGLALVGGIIYMLSGKGPTLAGTHRVGAPKPCPRFPPTSAFASGTVLQPGGTS